MNFRGHEPSFREADRRYAELKRRLDAGTMSVEEFDAERRWLMVQDDEGRWWAKSRKTGEWNYHDGRAWVRGTPPDYDPPAESVPDPPSWSEPGERSPASRTTFSGGAPVRDPNEGKQRRRAPRRVVVAVVLVVMVSVLGGTGIVAVRAGGWPGWGSTYVPFEHDSGALSVEVPSEWDERLDVDSEGEKGRASWSSFLDDGGSAGPSLTAVNDLYSWRNGTAGHRGVYMVASKKLAQAYTDDDLVASGPNDYSATCEAGPVKDFDRPPYSGKMLEWSNCGGKSDHLAVTLAAAPEGRECVVVLQVGGYYRNPTEKEGIQHVLDTFETDCGKIE